jgi:hypothetical protein
MTGMDCERCLDLAPELALGIAEGHERAAAVAHLTSCPACRRELDDLAVVADRLLLAVPAVDPPAGFEATTLARFAPPAGVMSRLRRALRPTLTAAAVVLVFVAGLGVGVVTRGSPLADLAADAPLRTAPLTDGAGRLVGSVAVQEGRSPRILVVLGPRPTSDHYVVECDDEDGDSYRAGALTVVPDDDQGKVWTATVSFEVDDVTRVRLVGDSADHQLVAPFAPI